VSYVTGVPLEKGYVYSNTNYILAQMIIERVTHDTYADQLMRRITIPLRLRSMCDAPYTCPAAAATRMPAGYFFDSAIPELASLLGKPVPKLNLSWAQGAGGIVSSLRDMTTWDRALYQGDELPGKQQRELESLVSKKSGLPISGTTPADPSGFGLGVGQAITPYGTVWNYEGETYGFRVLHLYWPNSGLIIALGANSHPTSDQLAQLGLSAYQILQKAGALPAG